jgi:Tfp pilus assembly protein FimT
MRRDSGLTAFEVAVTLAIVAILATVTMPSFLKWLQAHRLRGSAINLMADIEMAKVRAMREGTFVTLELAENTYQVFLDNGEGVGGVAGDEVRNGTETLMLSRQLPSGVRIPSAEVTPAGNSLRFSSRGTARDNLVGEKVIPLVNTAGRKTVSVNRLGSVQIQ